MGEYEWGLRMMGKNTRRKGPAQALSDRAMDQSSLLHWQSRKTTKGSQPRAAAGSLLGHWLEYLREEPHT
jgi:hypothetical protein